MKKSSKRICSLEDWNNCFNKSIKEKVQQDLFVVFDDEELNFEDNLPGLGQSIDEFMGKDFIKYITERNTKQDLRKSSGLMNLNNANAENKGQYQLFSQIEYQKLENKGEVKKEEIRRLKEILLKVQADREAEEKGTIFTIFRVDHYDQGTLFEPSVRLDDRNHDPVFAV